MKNRALSFVIILTLIVASGYVYINSQSDNIGSVFESKEYSSGYNAAVSSEKTDSKLVDARVGIYCVYDENNKRRVYVLDSITLDYDNENLTQYFAGPQSTNFIESFNDTKVIEGDGTEWEVHIEIE